MPTIPEALAIAMHHHEAGRLQPAEQIYRQILQVEPYHAGALHLIGLIAHQVGQNDIAVDYMQRAIALDPIAPAFHNNLGEAFRALQRIPEAVACYSRALNLAPDYAEARNNLGLAFASQGRLDEGETAFRQALKLKPDFAPAHSNLGIVLFDRGHLEEAVACHRRALELRPDFAEALNNLGNVLRDLRQLDEAVACCRRALEVRPNYPEAHSNLGNALRDQAKLDEAETEYNEAIRQQPTFEGARLNRSLLWLLRGEFGRGWPEYEWRWAGKSMAPRRFTQPRWDSSPLDGKTILLYPEQGLGDTLMTVRYAPLVKARGGRVLLECQPELTRLLEQADGVDAVTPSDAELPPFDVQVPLLSLPGIFGTDLTSIPANIPYSHAAPEATEAWRGELAALPGFKVGIAWQGSTVHKGDRHRSVPLTSFAPLAAVPGVTLVSLQKGFGREQIEALNGAFPIVDFTPRLQDFADTAALVPALDLVVSVDSAVVHLAGGLGQRVWTAVPQMPDWRWLLDRDDSPWYPSMRLFRQETPGEWPGVFARLAAELARVIGEFGETTEPDAQARKAKP